MSDEVRYRSRSGGSLPVPNSVARANVRDQELAESESSLTSTGSTAAPDSASGTRLDSWHLPRRLRVVTDTRILRELLSTSVLEMKEPKTDDGATLVQQIRQEAKERQEERNNRIRGTSWKTVMSQKRDAPKERKSALPSRTFSFQQVTIRPHTTFDALVASIRDTVTEDPLRTFGPKLRYSTRNCKLGQPDEYKEN